MNNVSGVHAKLLLTVLVLASQFSAWSYADVKGTALWYREHQVGTEVFEARYIVTADFLRSDEIDPDEGFMLFNRKTRQLYSVSPENKTVLHIDGKGSALKVPGDLKISTREKPDPEVPDVFGKKPLEIEILANGTVCFSAVVVPGFLDDVQQAFIALSRALMVQQSRTLDNTPEQYRTPCFMTQYLYAADRHLNIGIPLVEWHPDGDRRELLRYETDVSFSDELFVVPDDYEGFQID